MNKILITGGCGFLGYYLVKEIREYLPQSTVKIIDLRDHPCKNFRITDTNIEITLGKDITVFDSIKDEFTGFDTVIHCAGLVSFSLKDKENLFRVNVEGTKNVLTAAIENKVQYFIHISSVAALGYKDKEDDLTNEAFEFDWNSAEKKKKFYMLTKYIADIEVKKLTKKMKTLIIYPGLMFGPGDLRFSAKSLQFIKSKKVLFNTPGGTNVVDVRDVAKGIITAMKDKISGDFLLSGHNLSYLESNTIIAEVVEKNPLQFMIPKSLRSLLHSIVFIFEKLNLDFEFKADNIDSAFKYRYYDNSKAKNMFNWNPKIDFKKTIQDTYDWMVQDDFFNK